MIRHRLAVVGVLAFIATLYLTFRLLGYPAGLFCTTFVGGFLLWMPTLRRHEIDPLSILIPHLITVAFFIIHVYEEYRAHIETVMSWLTGMAVTQTNFLTIAAFIAPVIWLSGLLMSLRRWQFGYFLVCVFYFGMMFGEPMHFVFPFLQNGTFHYVAGMYTAVLPSLAGWWTFATVVREIRRGKTVMGTGGG